MGTLDNNTDFVIKLEGVTSLTAADLNIGAQGTGASITITAASPQVSLTLNNARYRQTTALDDTISSQGVYLTGGVRTIDGGLGADTLVLTDGGGTIDLSQVSSVETLNLTAATSASPSPTPSILASPRCCSARGVTPFAASATATSVLVALVMTALLVATATIPSQWLPEMIRIDGGRGLTPSRAARQ